MSLSRTKRFKQIAEEYLCACYQSIYQDQAITKVKAFDQLKVKNRSLYRILEFIKSSKDITLNMHHIIHQMSQMESQTPFENHGNIIRFFLGYILRRSLDEGLIDKAHETTIDKAIRDFGCENLPEQKEFLDAVNLSLKNRDFGYDDLPEQKELQAFNVRLSLKNCSESLFSINTADDKKRFLNALEPNCIRLKSVR